MLSISVFELVFLITVAAAVFAVTRGCLTRRAVGILVGAGLSVTLTPADLLSTATVFGVGLLMLTMGGRPTPSLS